MTSQGRGFKLKVFKHLELNNNNNNNNNNNQRWHVSITKKDDNYSPLDLKKGNCKIPITSVAENFENWKQKVMQGKCPTYST